MSCKTCKYWKPTYAEYAKKLVMTCTNKDKTYSYGGCKYFEVEDKETKDGKID